MKHRRLFLKLFPATLATLLLSLGLLTFLAGRAIRLQSYDLQQQDLLERARLLAPQVAQLLRENRPGKLQGYIRQVGPRSHTRITVMLPDGSVIAESDTDPARMQNHLSRPEMEHALSSGVGSAIRTSPTLGIEMVYSALLLRDGDRPVAVIRTSVPLLDLLDQMSDVYRPLLATSLVLALVAVLLVLRSTRRISRPLESMRRAAELYAGGRLSFRVEPSPISEFNSLALAMNHMAGSLEEKIASLARERNIRDALLDSMNEGVIGFGRDQDILFVNRAAVRLLGLPGDRITGRPLAECLPPALHPVLLPALERRGAQELDLAGTGDDRRTLALGVTVLHDLSDREIGSLAVFAEITRMKRLEKVREDFVANVSHELRTPITSIRGFVENLNEGALEDPALARRFLGIIERQVVRLSAIIDDLLALSRIERDEKEQALDLQPVNLRLLAEEVLELCSVQAAQHGIRLELDCPAEASWLLDEAMLQRALINLVENAIKYSPGEGTVSLRIRMAPGELRIQVQDQGQGIPAEHLPRLFERFYVVDRARSRHLGGTGLGLSIVKHIARAHGGRVSVESSPGGGSRFTLHLPPRATGAVTP
jgi:two-component system phosphate regulon sensor histidine kinase PhoR